MEDKMKEMINKSKLTKEELKQFFKLTAKMDHKLDHSRAYRTMMNETRRELLKFIGYEIRNMKDIRAEFNEEVDRLDYHLSMLKQCLYIFDSIEGWKATPRGLGFLENVRFGDT